MVVPSALADSLNAPAMMGMLGAAGLVPKRSTEDEPEDGVPAAVAGLHERAKLPEVGSTPYAGRGVAARD